MKSKAWVILTEEEQAALSLSINHGKSTWQAGEILGKAHYKYLEIQARARAFFEMFTLYFEEFGESLIPQNSDLPWDFKLFIIYSIEERMGYRDVLKKIGKDSELSAKKAIDRIATLVTYMETLHQKMDKQHKALFDLIKEFDRWNNFRILPEVLQEPSAFKRRNKTRLVKHLNNVKDIGQYHIDRIINRFSPSPKYKGDIVYLPILDPTDYKGYQVLPIKSEPSIYMHISKDLHLYLFEDKDQADDFGFLVSSYLNQEGKTCRHGQKFWPKFRTSIKLAINYNEVNNIIPRRSNLETAFKDLDRIRVERMDKKGTYRIIESFKPATRTGSKDLWKI